VEAELFQADGRTETTKLIAAFRNFANAPNSTQTSVFSSQNTLGITIERQLLNALWGKKSLLTEGIMHNVQIQNCDKIQAIRYLCLVMETTLSVEELMSFSFLQVKDMSQSPREAKIRIYFDPIRNGQLPIPVAAQSKAWVCDCTLAGIAGPNSAGACTSMSVVSVVCCQVAVSASGWSLVKRSPTERGVSQCDREFSTMRRPWPTVAVATW
jgi:hypothetical protein